MQDAFALALAAPGSLAATPDDDWLSLPEEDLAAMHAEALALYRREGDEVPFAGAAASLALLHQLMMARAVVPRLRTTARAIIS